MEDDNQLKVQFTVDRTEAMITFKERYTALEIETLMFDLAEIRSLMAPAVPHKAPDPDASSDNDQISCFAGADITAGVVVGDQVALQIRHPGTGWLYFTLDPRAALELGRYLLSLPPAKDLEPSPFSISPSTPH
ncbi:hypothetical protein K2O51_23440 [Cupriavidus pinatubonensis]|uniref:hypothetical protein n=1 Tax=Cupriavidus pinatubonensis TaxID=248026 RepID=UPI001C73A705|nr:hypothetical protein [Cupriavidus pinatubonensis]QYY30326.1 hypothetical protein K2O51_23440 [Cupriavidus pinatubonensis]